MKVFSGTSNEPLARAICDYIGIELGKSTIKPFPDGETFVKIEENVRAYASHLPVRAATMSAVSPDGSAA